MASYTTINEISEGLYREKGSKFVGYAIPVTTAEEAKEHVDRLRKENPGANHVCHAWKLGADGKTYFSSDDREPSGTAGLPILRQIDSSGLTNLLVAVVRYFGGTKLGASGLVHAYKTSAKEALENAKPIKAQEMAVVRLQFEPAVQHKVMAEMSKVNGTQMDAQYGALGVEMTISLPLSAVERFEKALDGLADMEMGA